MKKTEASWNNPTLGIECPECGEWNDYWEQFSEDGHAFEWFRNLEEKDVEGVVFTCPDCQKEFGLSGVGW